jgi:hypothetical protein
MSPASAVNHTVAIFRELQRENSTLHHFARDPDGKVTSTMYLTPFAYQFFIYNSLYQIDWAESVKNDEIKPSPHNDDEKK